MYYLSYYVYSDDGISFKGTLNFKGEFNPDNYLLLSIQSKVLFDLEKFNEALEHYEKLLEIEQELTYEEKQNFRNEFAYRSVRGHFYINPYSVFYNAVWHDGRPSER